MLEPVTPRERFQSALELRSVDRTPVFYQHLGASSYLQSSLGCTVRDAYSDPYKFASLVIESHKQFGYDNVMVGWGDLLTEAQAHGLKWKFTDPRFYPRPDAYLPVGKAGEIHPVDPGQDPFWSVQLKAAKQVFERLGDEIAVVGSCSSPTWIACETIGMESLMMAYFQQSDLVHSMLRAIVQSCKAYGERVHEVGIEEIFVDDSGAGKEMVSLEMYEEFDSDYLLQVMEHWRKLGLRTIIHNDSAEPFYEAQANLGPSALHVHLQAVDVPKFFKVLRGRLCVMAGIDHMTLLFKKSPDEVGAEVRRVMGLWGDDPGFVIAPGCELPYKTPLENIRRLKEATANYHH
jgi:MtaA/CmuA family methyltransferase